MGQGQSGEVLIAIMNSVVDMTIARDRHWYRIPVDQVAKLQQRQQWQPKWLAFYQTKVFADEAHAVNYFAEVIAIREVTRAELFPDETQTAKSHKRYYKVELTPLQKLPQPIKSPRLRRITFIPTTWEKLTNAQAIENL